MALTRQRDLDTVVDGIARWLQTRHGSGVEVVAVDRPTVGWSGETVLVRFRVDGADDGVAVRLPPLGEGIFPTQDLRLQAEAMAAARAAEVPVPAAEVVADPAWLGEPFLAMTLVEGHVPGELPAFDPWAGGRADLHDAVTDVLLALHTVPVPAAVVPHRSVADELAWWSDYLDWSGGREVPALDDALAWCHLRRPTTEPPAALLWGDVRLGNVVFAEDGAVAAVLDWEMATIGAPEHDLGWWWGLEALQDEVAGGRGDAFPALADLRARYEQGLGRPLQDLGWYETFALTRSAAILTRISLLEERAGLVPRLPVQDNPVLDHLRRRTHGPSPPSPH